MKKLVLIALALVVLVGVGLFLAVRVLLSPDSVRSAIEAQASAAFGMPVKVGTVSAQLWPRAGLRLTDVRVGEPAQVTLRRALLSTGLRPLLSRRVEDAEVIVEDSRVDLIALLATLDALGGAGATPQESGSSTPAFTIASVRTMGLRNVELVVGKRRATVSVESSLSGDRLDITHLSARAEGSQLEATGSVESLARRVARLDIVADPLDLDGLLELAAAFSRAPTSGASGPTRGEPMAIDLRAEVHAQNGRFAGMTFTDLVTTIAVTPERVTLSPLALRLFEGGVEGDIAIGLGSPPELRVTGTLEDIDAQKLAAFAGQPNAITGTLNGRMKVSGRGLDPAAALQAARGTADVAIVKGRMPGLNLVRPVVLFFGHPKGAPPEGSGEAFERISATLAIDQGLIQTDDLVFQSRDVDMTGTGSLATAGGTLDVRANLMLSEELSAQAGRDLVRYTREGNRVVLPATITGTVAAPRVMIDEGAAAKRALRNELERRTKSVFDKLLRRKKPQP
ncbi:MAG: AsmA family protein [Luteitalea sp.]|nr:AsmA family protein [Luteitalea sp.]